VQAGIPRCRAIINLSLTAQPSIVNGLHQN
jgi:hypothetical protein